MGGFAHDNPLWRAAELAARASNLLDAELAKWDQDFRYLLDRLRNVLLEIGESELAELIAEAFDKPPSGRQC